MNDTQIPVSSGLPSPPPAWPDLVSLAVLASVPAALLGLLSGRAPGRIWFALPYELPSFVFGALALVRFVGWEWRRPFATPTLEGFGKPGASTSVLKGPAAYYVAWSLLMAYLCALTFGDLIVLLAKGTAYVAHRSISDSGLLPMPSAAGLLVFVIVGNVDLLANKRWATIIARCWIAACAGFPAVTMLVHLVHRRPVAYGHPSIAPFVYFGAGSIIVAFAAKVWMWWFVLRAIRLSRPVRSL